MESLQHFSHEHALSLVQWQHDQNNENSNKDDEDDDKDDDEDEEDFVVENHQVGTCKMCKEDIYSFHLCYYYCKECDYFLHKFCAQLPVTLQNHELHPHHNLTLSEGFQFNDLDFNFKLSFDSKWICEICKTTRNMFYNYHCSICDFTMDIICATMSKQKMHHPSHPHQLQRCFGGMISQCNACGRKHTGTFYHCTTCSWFKIHLACALVPTKLRIQQSTKESFSHPHLLTLAYSFPQIERKAKCYPSCRVCDGGFSTYEWHYRCNKCRYYVHVDCATSTREAFMSIFMPAGLGKIYKNFRDGDHPNLLRCPFDDESCNLLKHRFFNIDRYVSKGKKDDSEMFKHSSHQHPLILFDTPSNELIFLHNPMKKVELLCDGCLRPITSVPFYKCSQHCCGFVLHEWCSRLPYEIQDNYDHPEHKLVLMPKTPTNVLGLFKCKICRLPSNGFAYGCEHCEYYVDINCGFIPDVIIHEAHSNHLLLRFKAAPDFSGRYCKACGYTMRKQLGFHCPICDFYLHSTCALLLPTTVSHKYDKHALSLRYYPAENYSSEYFCEICEDEFDPTYWFYHCSICASSMHTACAPLNLQCELSTYSKYKNSIFRYINVKFGGTHEITDHPNPVTFVQGINDDGECTICDIQLQYNMIFKCFRCKFACHVECVDLDL